MLELTHIMDKDTIADIFCEIFGNNEILLDAMIVALLKDKKIIGLAFVNMYKNGVILNKIGILKKHRGEGNGDFFTRALLYMLTVSGNPFYINYYDKYYERFGFERFEEDKMWAETISYPADCGGH